jgi:hypothetical protein
MIYLQWFADHGRQNASPIAAPTKLAVQWLNKYLYFVSSSVVVAVSSEIANFAVGNFKKKTARITKLIRQLNPVKRGRKPFNCRQNKAAPRFRLKLLKIIKGRWAQELLQNKRQHSLGIRRQNSCSSE